MVIFNSKEIERTQQQKLHYDVSVTVSTVPSFFGDTGQFDSRRPGLGEGRKGKGELMRAEKSEGGRKRQGWAQGATLTARHIAQALSSLRRISFVTERFQKQQELYRHTIVFRGKPPAPSLNYISVALERPLLGLWEHRERRLLGWGAGLRRVG